MSLSISRILISLVFASALFAAALPAFAQSCPATPCGTGQLCVQGQCRTVTGGGDAGTPSTPPNPGDAGTPPADSGRGDQGLVNPLKDIDSLEDLLKVVLDAVVRIGTIILVLALVYVGFLFVVAQGNEEKIRNARSALLWTVIGGLILLGASAIGAVIGDTAKSFTS